MYNTILVTAFFDIGRKKYNNNSRSVSAYLEYFQRWARIKNYLVVFCGDEEVKDKILQIRKNYNLENMTKVILIENIFNVEEDIYRRMSQIETDPCFLQFRLEKNIPENIANYNYITNLKCWFLYRASLEEDIAFEYAAWIDFGFDHGGKLFYDENDWSFELEVGGDIDKVQLFYLPEKLEERPVFEVIRTVHPDSINGNLILCPKLSIRQLWICVRESIYNMLYLGLMDDDQTIFLLASRRVPELFELRKSYWFLPVTYFGGEHMKLTENFINPPIPVSLPFIKRIYRKCKKLYIYLLGKK